MKIQPSNSRILTVILFLLFLSFACSKDDSGDEANIVSYTIAGQQSVQIDRTAHTVGAILPESIITIGSTTAQFTLSDGATATVNGVPQVSGVTINNFSAPVTYKVRSEDLTNTIDWTVSATNNNYTLQWGLGQFLKATKSNNKTYEWYIDQFSTGTWKAVNCGPTSTVMAAKWSNQAFTKTPEDARAAYRSGGGWWYTTDVDAFLSGNSIPHSTVSLSTSAAGTGTIITSRIDAGNIVILCLDMYYIRKQLNEEYRLDKFYNTSAADWGHFIVVKGYKRVDNELLFEVYDPYSNSLKYTDLSFKGRNRYYRSSDIYTATSIWWNFAIVISPYGVAKSDSKGLDPTSIPVAWGR